ncbi:monofunctional biosynthetic peptidoglycan transglycosylase [Saccharophagus sp. K07]|jgi:monofunctional biosynthetic peptidoglycan transglycosylase|uniref:monofunctional biosynthetic peptidoglycan transglycosylase n=1 Tax=Saccharophagus sp. K07 TaxID=2283636 RepID=UPI001651BE97|nr:monofunctional biosynthetic peptidoglycan transglycosylase [Saccharophagus sp. K07]MBC6905395.1 monofunctional biosynthetic peptidoglycan transglycosylase [Saccharophagus sp. K07]
MKRILLGALLLFLSYQLWIFAHVLWWKENNPSETSFMRIRLNELREHNPDAELYHEWIEYEQISNHLKRAVIAAEDGKFLQHRGFDWDGMERAIKKNQQRGKRAAGGSTISQQLAKNLFLSPSKSYIRKAQEAIITVMIEASWSKRRILEVYLNVVEWGDGTFGAQAAAWRHYRTSAVHLSPAQAAHLAVLLPNPRQHERRLPDYAQRYSRVVLQRMPKTSIP